MQITAVREPRARMKEMNAAGSRPKPLASGNRNMSTRFPVSMGWSVQRPKVGIGMARLSRTRRWSIQVISSVEPLPIATVCGLSPSVVLSSEIIVSALLG